MTATATRPVRPLTRRQKDTLIAWVRLFVEGQCPPTLEEVSKAMGMRYRHSACSHLDSLVVKGWLTCVPKVARGYRLAEHLTALPPADLLRAAAAAPTAKEIAS